MTAPSKPNLKKKSPKAAQQDAAHFGPPAKQEDSPAGPANGAAATNTKRYGDDKLSERSGESIKSKVSNVEKALAKKYGFVYVDEKNEDHHYPHFGTKDGNTS